MHLKVCAREGCYKVFDDDHGRKYCSSNCRSKEWYKRAMKKHKDSRPMTKHNCLNCGKWFYTVSTLRKYCSGNCKQQHYRERMRFDKRSNNNG